ncbi:ATP-binding protein [Marivita sp. GX14005]|uniref:two-component system sensor histidine kinase NtrB n=1 Tax=Marivita sp. GX14005 TaxID=2942276 RepID=UPI0020199DD4|nr:ATP-binding protein [Marivita sp. GX14005]MCL3883656.1 ATP-binding protein [Marivita sp. GX14005]
MIAEAAFDEAIWSALPAPVIVIDAADRIVDLNPAAEGFMNQSARALRGEPVWDRLAVDAPLESGLERARRLGTPLFVNDVDIGTGSSAPVQCTLHIAPLQGGQGRMLLLIAARDFALRAQPSASSARSAIGMAEMLAHEIKNPLAGITGAAQLLGMSLGAQDRELTDLIVAETRRIVTLLDRVEQFGNRAGAQLVPTNLHDVLDRAARSAALGLGAHMRIEKAYDPSLPPALADPDQMLQVAQNLIHNAADAAGRAGGTITLRTYYEQSYNKRPIGASGQSLPLQIEVIDDGPGLPSEIAADIFAPFVSGRENGTGLGLALVSKIIADHDGWIAVDSRPGRTAFRISLPQARRAKGDS